MMFDLIDREKLLKQLKISADHHEENSRDYVLMLRDRTIVREQPTVNAIPKSVIEGIKAELAHDLKEAPYMYDDKHLNELYGFQDGIEHAIKVIDKYMESEDKEQEDDNT